MFCDVDAYLLMVAPFLVIVVDMYLWFCMFNHCGSCLVMAV